MRAKILDGKSTAEQIREELKGAVEALLTAGCKPHLAMLCVGDNPASHVYLRAKSRACEKLGVDSTLHTFPADVEREHLASAIHALNEHDTVHGMILQLPLPGHLPEDELIATISPGKDVDGFHPTNVGLLAAGTPRFVPCTPLGVVALLKRYSIHIEGAHAVVIGRSRIVGRPLANLLSTKAPDLNATVTLCHSGTAGLARLTKQADILIAAVGRPGVITAAMVKPGAAVVDVGMNRVPDPSKSSGYRLTGDVAFEETAQVADWITPVPGGVGPMTVAMLMGNTVKAAALRTNTEVELTYYA